MTDYREKALSVYRSDGFEREPVSRIAAALKEVAEEAQADNLNAAIDLANIENGVLRDKIRGLEADVFVGAKIDGDECLALIQSLQAELSKLRDPVGDEEEREAVRVWTVVENEFAKSTIHRGPMFSNHSLALLRALRSKTAQLIQLEAKCIAADTDARTKTVALKEAEENHRIPEGMTLIGSEMLASIKARMVEDEAKLAIVQEALDEYWNISQLRGALAQKYKKRGDDLQRGCNGLNGKYEDTRIKLEAMKSRLMEAEAISAGRREALMEKAAEAAREWTRAERAEADSNMYKGRAIAAEMRESLGELVRLRPRRSSRR